MVKNHKWGQKIIFRVLLCLLMMHLTMADPPLTGDWQLVWNDEFDSGSTPEYPNSDNWGYENGYVRNNEWQYYTNSLQNAYCQDGFLHIEAHKHPVGTYPQGTKNPDYQDGSISSASLRSMGKVSYKYGWLEMQARIDTQWGSWPAFWTLGVSGGWPDGGECDIMEYYRDMLKFNVAWWKTGNGPWSPHWDGETVYLWQLPSDWSDQFHVWAMEWTADYVKLYMDGVLYNTWDASQDNNGGTDTSTEGFQQPHYMLLNQAIGGDAGGDASGVVYPTSYEIDYVRWYQNNTPTIQPKQMYDRSDFSASNVRGPDPYETGNKFVTGSIPPTITALGFIDLHNTNPAGDPDGDGLLESHRVTLWRDADGSKVTEVTVPAGAAGHLIDSFRYAVIPENSLILEAHTAYVVSADTAGIQDAWLDEEGLTPDIDFIDDNISDSTTWQGRWGTSGQRPTDQWHTGFFYGLANITSEPILRMDYDDSGAVDILDLMILSFNWLQAAPAYDIAPVGGDGIVDLLEFQVLAGEWSP